MLSEGGDPLDIAGKTSGWQILSCVATNCWMPGRTRVKFVKKVSRKRAEVS